MLSRRACAPSPRTSISRNAHPTRLSIRAKLARPTQKLGAAWGAGVCWRAQWLSKSAACAGARRQRQLSPDQTDCAHNLYQAMKCAVILAGASLSPLHARSIARSPPKTWRPAPSPNVADRRAARRAPPRPSLASKGRLHQWQRYGCADGSPPEGRWRPIGRARTPRKPRADRSRKKVSQQRFGCGRAQEWWGPWSDERGRAQC